MFFFCLFSGFPNLKPPYYVSIHVYNYIVKCFFGNLSVILSNYIQIISVLYIVFKTGILRLSLDLKLVIIQGEGFDILV